MQATSAISVINDDVLQEVFEWLSDIDPPRRPAEIFLVRKLNVPETRFRFGWIYATHVNQQWRRVLLSMSPLWAKIVCIVPQSAADECLARARDSPWHIILGRNERLACYSKFTTLALSAMERVRVLDDSSLFNWFPGLHNKTLPELVRLNIAQLSYRDTNLHVYAPNLRECTLYHMPTVLIAPSLRFIKLRSRSIPNPASLLLGMLATLPLLEEMDIELPSTVPIEWENTGNSLVALMHLRTVELYGFNDSSLDVFWQKLIIPSPEYTQITYNVKNGWPRIVDTFAPCLARRPYNTLAFLYGRLVQLHAFHCIQGHHESWNDRTPRRGARIDIIPAPRRGDDDNDADISLQDVLLRMLGHLETQTAHITHMSFLVFDEFDLYDELEDDPDRQPLVVVRNELRRFTAVASVSGWFYNFHFGLLEIPAGEETTPIFPALHTLIACVPAQGDSLESMKRHWGELNAVLESRARANVPIRRLELVGAKHVRLNEVDEMEAVQTDGLARARLAGQLQEFVDKRWAVRR